MSSDGERVRAALGQVVKSRRDELRWTQDALAIAAELDGADEVDRLERGARDTTLVELFRVARAFGDPVGVFLVDVISAWQADPSDAGVYESRVTDFERLYRLGYYRKVGEFCEHWRAYTTVGEARRAAGTLNGGRVARGFRLLDTMCIYVRMGYTRFAANAVVDGGSGTSGHER